MNSIEMPNVWDKIQNIEKSCEMALENAFSGVSAQPGRDATVLDSKLHPPKMGFSQVEGQARMLHDLASIELQAMELGLRTLIEFPEAPAGFRAELAAVTISEGQHLRLCLDGIADMGYAWGHWPVHTALWNAVASSDSLLDRILIVHRYLEGSGLDAGDNLVRRLEGMEDRGLIAKRIVKQINFEEIGHVDFGSQWYREVCRLEKIDSQKDFPERMEALRVQLPKRMEKINHDLRRKAGFTESELEACEAMRLTMLPPKSRPQNTIITYAK